MKKYLPYIVVLVFAILFVGVVFIIRKINQPVTQDVNQTVDQAIPDLPQNELPTLALIPSVDGHSLTLKILSIKVPSAVSMDYELTWTANNTGAPSTQGTSGTVQLNGQTNVERDNLLLGSESSGKKRYDKGVEDGGLTLRFRDSNGKLLGKVTTDWHLQTGTTTLTSVDSSFKYILSKPADGVWFITIKSFGVPDPATVVTFSSGWAIYASDGLSHAGNVG